MSLLSNLSRPLFQYLMPGSSVNATSEEELEGMAYLMAKGTTVLDQVSRRELESKRGKGKP